MILDALGLSGVDFDFDHECEEPDGVGMVSANVWLNVAEDRYTQNEYREPAFARRVLERVAPRDSAQRG